MRTAIAARSLLSAIPWLIDHCGIQRSSGGVTSLLIIGGLLTLGATAQAVPIVDGTLKLRLDATNVTETAGLVSLWNDLSPSGVNDFEQTVPTSRPARTLGAINGQPVVTFTTDRLDAVAGHTLNTSGALPFTFFAVGQGAADSLALFDSAPGSPEVFRFFGSNQIELWAGSPTLGVSPDTTGIAYSVRASLPSNRLLEVREFRGATAASSSAVGNTNQIVFSNPDIGTINGGGNGSYAGGIAEILYYNGFLSDAARNITENYLAARYDRSLLGSNDFYAGRDPGKGNYDFDVVGIGRESNGTVTASPANEGGGLLISEANSSLNNGNYVIAGHANGPNGTTTNDMPMGLERWERSWYIDTTGVGTVNLAFDWDEAGINAPFDASFVGLYFRPNNSGLFSLIATGTVDIGNQRVDFLNVALDPNDGYYTLGVAVPEPSTLALLGLGAIGLAIRTRRRRTAA